MDYVDKVRDKVRTLYAADGQSVAHRMDHIERVLNNTRKIGKYFPDVDWELLTLATLLHDVTSPYNRKEKHVELSMMTAREILTGIGYPAARMERVIEIIAEHSTERLKTGNLSSTEARILFDADKIDGLGPNGIARAFALFGQRGYAPPAAVAWYRKKIGTALGNMKTGPGKEMALERLPYVEEFLQRFEKLGRHEDALKDYDRALIIDSNNDCAWSSKGTALSKLKKYQESLSAYDQAILIDPNSAYVLNLKGDVLAKLGKVQDALQTYDKVLLIDPENASAWKQKGNLLNASGKLLEALDAYHKALSIDLNDALGWTSKGNVLAKLARYEEALIAHEKAISVDPNDAFGWICKGNTLKDLRRFQDSLEAYNKSLSIDVNDPYGWTCKGLVLEEMGKFEEAINCFDRALNIAPDDQFSIDSKRRVKNILDKNKPAPSPIKPKPDNQFGIQNPQILREYEYFGGSLRFKISVNNCSPNSILDVMLDLDIDENVLSFNRYEPASYSMKSGKIILGNIHPNSDRTISVYLEPLICAKEGTDVHCFVRYKDASGMPKNIQMDPLNIQVICPTFNTEKPLNIGQIKILIDSLRSRDSKIYTFPNKIDALEVLETCKQVALLHDIWHISTLNKENFFESWFYGKTKVSKKDLIIKTFIDKNTDHLEIAVVGDDPKDITGLLAEINRNLTNEFKKIGNLQNVYNITIKDSLIQRTNLLSYCDMNGNCFANVTIQDSVVQRSNFLSQNRIEE